MYQFIQERHKSKRAVFKYTKLTIIPLKFCVILGRGLAAINQFINCNQTLKFYLHIFYNKLFCLNYLQIIPYSWLFSLG